MASASSASSACRCWGCCWPGSPSGPGPDAVPWRERLFSQNGLRGRRRLANLHRALAFRALLPLLLAVCTGLTLAFPQTTQRLLYRVTTAIPQPPPMPGDGPVDLAGALALAEAARP